MHVQITNDQTEWKLASAILIYQGRRIGNTIPPIATVHPILKDNGQPRIGPGRCLSVQHLHQMANALSRRKERNTAEFIPEHVLYQSAEAIIWYKPSHREPIYFKTRQKELDDLTGQTVTHPNLVFKATRRNLRVFAIEDSRRPTPATALYQAPYFNVYENGTLCEGTALLPRHATIPQIPQFEAGFFKSAFTHSNIHHATHRIANHPRGHSSLWREMTTRTNFPKEYLYPVKLSVRHLLSDQ